jgi:hypothetical protein
VGLRYACPSAASSKGRPLKSHDAELKAFAQELLSREGVRGKWTDADVPPPPLQPGQKCTWDDLQRFVKAILLLISNRQDRMERRLRKCLALAQLCREATFEQVHGNRLDEFLELISANLEVDVPIDPNSLPAPRWIGRILFRQAVALYARKDSGPNRGPATQSRLSLFAAAGRFARGTGPIPRLHRFIAETTFEQVEKATGPWPEAVEEVLDRYYLTKVGSMQFFGRGYFDVPFWEGLEALVLTFPAVAWLTRAQAEAIAPDTMARAISVMDDHYGLNLVLGSSRQRFSFHILARTGELTKLVAWYAR